MPVLPKKYLRSFAYLLLLIPLLLGIQRIKNGGISQFKIINEKGSPPTEAARLPADGIEHAKAQNQVVVNIGKQRCFHVGKLWEYCYTKDELVSERSPLIEKKRIPKDLKGSYGYNWFGISEYLFYDVLKLESFSTLNDNDLSKYIVIDSLSDQKSEGTKNVDNLYVTTKPLSMYYLKSGKHIVSDLNVLFGEDCIDPRPGWILQKSWTLAYHRFPSYITYRLLNLAEDEENDIPLFVKKDGKFKVIQIGDLHLGIGKGECSDEFPKHESCDADPKTIKFIENVLDIESPNLVVFTGDQIMGDRSVQDSESSLLKALAPVIERKIPWALVWGNHDDEGSLTRWQLSELTMHLPYSLFRISPKDTKDNSFGVGNYVHQVTDSSQQKALITLYFLDSHKYSRTGKIYPGYDWIKEAQWEYMKQIYDEKLSQNILKASIPHMSLAFFHIPLPEYLNLDSKTNLGEKNSFIGNLKEGVTAPKYNSGGVSALNHMGVHVTSCGHDHCNDYCLLDDSDVKKIWLCYGGGAGEGGYAGYGGTERRIRIYEIDTKNGNIYTWKRLNSSPDQLFDYQLMVSDGVPNAV